jgi:2-hydroxymuconate-semialdehyde hydrolase
MRAMSEPAELSGRDLLEAALRSRVAPPPYFQLLDMRCTGVSDGMATFEMPASADQYNPNGVVHGGAISSLADSAMGFAVFSTCAPGESFTTAELHLNFLRAVTADSGLLRSTGRVVHRGQQLAVAEAEVFDQQNQLVARASSTNVILQRRMPMRAPSPHDGIPTAAAPPSMLPAEAIPSPSPMPAFAPPPAPVPPFVAAPVPPVPPVVMAPPIAPGPPPMPASPPPSPLEHAPTPMVSVPMTTELITPAPLAQTKRKIRTFAGDIAYVRKGQGPALLLIHGIPSSSYLWRDVIDPLSATFDVLAPDLLGYGDSDKRLDADLSIAAQARYIVAFMESIGVHQAAVVGHDIGGGIAQLMAVDEPQRVARLILIDSIVDNNWPVADIARLKEPVWDQIMVNLDLRDGFRKGLEAGTVTEGRVTDELVDEWTRPFQDLGGRRAYLRAARALNNRDLTTESRHIQEIEAPTLILWGANDKFLEPRWADTLKHKLRDTTVDIIEPGGHFLPLDRPDAVVEAITRFLTTR